MAQNRKKGMAKRALSVSLVAAMLATSNTPAWASGFMNENEDGVQAFFNGISEENVILFEASCNDFGVSGNATPGSELTISGNIAGADSAKYYGVTVAKNGGTAELVGAENNGKTSYALSGTYTVADAGEYVFTLYESDDDTFDSADTVVGKSKTVTVAATPPSGATTTLTTGNTVIKWENFDKGVAPTYTYEKGKVYAPEIEKVYLKDTGEELIIDDGTLVYTSWTNNDKVGAENDASVTVSFTAKDKDGNEYSAANLVLNFTISPVEVKADAVTGVPTSVEYAPTAESAAVLADLAKAIVVKDVKGNTLVAKNDDNTDAADYELTLGALVTDKTVEATITFINDYAGNAAIVKNIKVAAKDISKFTVDEIADQTWTGGAVELTVGPDLNVKWNTKTATPLTAADVDLDYAGTNYKEGTATVTISGRGNYTGKTTATFKIVKAGESFSSDFETAVAADIVNAVYTGKAITPVKPGYAKDGGMTEGVDYKITYAPQNVDAGIVTVTVEGMGKYQGATLAENFEITQVALAGIVAVKNDANTGVTVADTAFADGLTHAEPAVTVKYNGMTLVQGRDYLVTYDAANVNAADRTVSVKLSVPDGVTGNYTGSNVEAKGALTSKDIKNISIPSIPAQQYIDATHPYDMTNIKLSDGTLFAEALKDGEKVLTLGTAFYVKKLVGNNKVGTATLTLAGRGNYTGEVDVTFSIVNEEITAVIYNKNGGTDLNITTTSYSYDGAIAPGGIAYTDATLIKVIDPKTGDPIADTKYDITYKNNTQAGDASIIVKGKAGYNVYAESTFKISPKVMTGLNVALEKNSFPYTASAVEPALDKTFAGTIKDGTTYVLKAGTDYEVTYEKNINAATDAKATVVGKGNYVFGDDKNVGLSATFTITAASIAKTNITAADVTYAGGIPVTYDITIKSPVTGTALVEGTDYTVALDNKANVGTSIATITLIGDAATNYTLAAGATPVVFRILPKSLADCDAKLVDGKVVIKNGELTVPETEYTVTENEDGTFTVKATEKNYTGTIVVSGAEAPAATQAKVASKTTSSVKVAWDAVEGAEGYTIWYHSEKDTANTRKIITGGDITSWTHKGLAAGTKYFYTVKAWVKDAEGKYVFGEETSYVRGTTMPFAAKIAKVTAANGKVKVALADEAAGAEKYSMCYSKSKDFASFQVGVRTSYTTRTFTKTLTAGTYYVRVKSYRDLGNNKRIYGAWSNTVKVVVK